MNRTVPIVCLLFAVASCTDDGASAVAADVADVAADAADVSSDLAADVDSGARVDVDDVATSDARDTADAAEAPWDPWAPPATGDPRTVRLCEQGADSFGDDPGEAAIFIDCAMDGGLSTSASPAPRDSLVVWAYNIERGFHIDEIIALMRDSPDVPRPDVVLLSEADRGCARTGYRNVTQELAEALDMNWAYATEFVELPRGDWPADGACEHGNAILSRYPLGNVRQVRHAANRSWYQGPDDRAGGEPRLGGRVAVVADIRVGERTLHASVLHLESHPNDAEYRDAQAEEMALEGMAQPHPAISGGDLNAPLYWVDLQSGGSSDATTQAFLSRGWVDAHAPLPYEERPTSRAFVIDLIFGHGVGFRDAAVCPDDVCGGLSDHLPVWATVVLP